MSRLRYATLAECVESAHAPLYARCRDADCRHFARLIPLKIAQRLGWQVSLDEIERRLRCRRCGSRSCELLDYDPRHPPPAYSPPVAPPPQVADPPARSNRRRRSRRRSDARACGARIECAIYSTRTTRSATTRQIDYVAPSQRRGKPYRTDWPRSGQKRTCNRRSLLSGVLVER